MAVGDELRKKFSAEDTLYSLGLQAVQVSSADAQALGSWVVEKKPPAKPAAHRTITTPDGADISSATGYLSVGNSAAVAAYVDLSTASSTADLFLALYDASSDLIGVTETITFSASGTYRDGGSGPYVSPRYLFDVSGASRVKVWCSALTGSPTVNVFLVPV